MGGWELLTFVLEREGDDPLDDLVAQACNRQVTVRGHFSTPVRVDEADRIGDGSLQLRVRTWQGVLEETVVTEAELVDAVATAITAAPVAPTADLLLSGELHRIAFAYAHGPYFTVTDWPLLGVAAPRHHRRRGTSVDFGSTRESPRPGSTRCAASVPHAQADLSIPIPRPARGRLIRDEWRRGGKASASRP